MNVCVETSKFGLFIVFLEQISLHPVGLLIFKIVNFLLNWVCYKSEILYIDLFLLSDPYHFEMLYVFEDKKNQELCSLTQKVAGSYWV